MELESALDILKENLGKNIFNIYVPSLKREVAFSPLTVGKIKTLAKLAIDSENVDENILYISFILDSCLEDLDIYELTELDKLYILVCLKEYNSIINPTYEIKCSKCSKKFKTKINYSLFKDKILKIIPESITFKKEIHGIQYEIELSNVNLGVLNDFNITNKKLLNDIKDEEKKSKFSDNLLNFLHLLFIKNISINNEKIKDFYKMKLIDRNKITDLLPDFINDEIKKQINTDNFNLVDNLKINVDCPSCKIKEKNEIYFGSSDFFYF